MSVKQAYRRRERNEFEEVETERIRDEERREDLTINFKIHSMTPSYCYGVLLYSTDRVAVYCLSVLLQSTVVSHMLVLTLCWTED